MRMYAATCKFFVCALQVEGEAETEAACNAHNMPEAPETSGAGAAPMNNVNGVFRPGWEVS